MRDLHRIRTPENVTFEFELAGLGSRASAWLLDALVMAALTIATSIVASLFGAVFRGLGMVVYFVSAFVIQWGYAALLELGWQGQTLGKRALGIRVLSVSGTPITFLQAAVRNLVRVVDILPMLYGVGATSALLDARGRRLGDIAANTVVVRVRRAPRPSAVVAQADRYNSFIHDQSVVLAVRRITPPERDAMIDLAMRRESLPLAVRYALFAKLAHHLEARLGVNRPDYFSEERFVLNLAAVALSSARELP